MNSKKFTSGAHVKVKHGRLYMHGIVDHRCKYTNEYWVVLSETNSTHRIHSDNIWFHPIKDLVDELLLI